MTNLYSVRLSCVGFSFGLFSAFFGLWLQDSALLLYLPLLWVLLLLFMGKLMFPLHYGEWWRSLILGSVFSSGLLITGKLDTFFGCYVCLLATFHYLEYAVTGLTNPQNLSTDSFLLNHSVQYWLAAFASWCEYFLELHFFPGMKKYLCFLSILGLTVCLGGEVLRKCAMFHAGNSFSHIVASAKKEDHVLITHGVFGYVRHPSYVGWFLWSIGTQMVLANPVCFLAYTFVSFEFFKTRIYVEEYTLNRFFGQDYVDYQKKVPVGIPFIKGFIEESQ